MVIDGNPSAATIGGVAKAAGALGVPVWFEPTSVVKAGRIVESGVRST